MEADDGDLLARMEQNLAERACHLHRELAGATVIRADDLVIADSGLDDDTFNIVAAARFTPRTAGRRIAETVTMLEATGRTFAWWVGPTSTPADLAARLAGAGLSASESESAMWARIGEPPTHPGPADLDIDLVATPEALADFAAVLAFIPSARSLVWSPSLRLRPGDCAAHHGAGHSAAREPTICCTVRTKSASWSRVSSRLSAM